MTESDAKTIIERYLKFLKQNKALPDSIEAMEMAINALENSRQAYDIDKVVEELEENASRYTKKYVTPYGNNGYKDTKAIRIHKAIEIVKQGGVSDDVCEWEVKSNYYVTKCSHDTDIMYGLKQDFKFCPYCGKNIKVV